MTIKNSNYFGSSVHLLILSIVVFVTSLCMDSALSVEPDPPCSGSEVVGEITSIENSVEVYNAVDDRKRQIRESDNELSRSVCSNDELRVGPNSRVAIKIFEINSILRLNQNTVFALGPLVALASDNADLTSPTEFLFSDFSNPVLDSAKRQSIKDYCLSTLNQSWLELKKGALRLFTTQPQRLNIKAPFLNASIEGTEFLIDANATATDVVVIEGFVGVCNEDGAIAATGGEQVTALAQGAPQRQLINPTDAVQWTLYYPPVFGDARTPDRVNTAYELAIAGQTEKAMLMLGNDDDIHDLVLRSLIAVTQNEADKALQLATESLALDMSLAAGWVALSYAQQALFDLPSALDSSRRAVQLDSMSSYYSARYAEMLLSSGAPRKALKMANAAVNLDPKESRSHTVLGFVQLNQRKYHAANDSLLLGAQLDETDPLPRLGLGLLKFRAGAKEQGRQQLEIAVNLDPNKSILRSYLGKAYAMLGRYAQAQEQFKIARSLDEQDPTPYLYSALYQQEIGEPIAALESLSAATERNDNRAIYRSRLNLDEDLASSTASTARIYRELGFDRLALLEGAKSVTHDSSSYSAHRLLADAYVAIPLHETARVSELLQSQIRQPLNNNPVQVRFAESSLSAFPDVGPYDTSVGEYSRLFTSNGFKGKAALEAGSFGYQAKELQLIGLGNKTSVVLGGYAFETDGERENSDETSEYFSAFLQHELAARNSVQLEFNSSDSAAGDLARQFDRSDFLPNDRNILAEESLRLGYQLKLENSDHLLVNLNRERRTSSLLDEVAPIKDNNSTGQLIEAQYNIETKGTTVVVGAGSVNQEVQSIFDAGSEFEESVNSEVDHQNAYIYSYREFDLDDLARIDMVLAVSHDRYDNSSQPLHATSETSPKFGVALQRKNVTYRLAAFDILQRTLTSSQTLEPTNIVGFNQFIDMFDATLYRTYAMGIDTNRKFQFKGQNANIFAGLSITARDMSIFSFADSRRGTANDDTAVGYVYVTHKPWTVGLTIEHERLRRDERFDLFDFLINSTANRITANLGFHGSRGLKSNLRLRYLQQDGMFLSRIAYELYGEREIYSGDEYALLIDASVGLPLRRFFSKLPIDGSLSLVIDNIMDEKIDHQDTDPQSSRYTSGRRLLVQLRLNAAS